MAILLTQNTLSLINDNGYTLDTKHIIIFNQ